jgi:hypothetical protein
MHQQILHSGQVAVCILPVCLLGHTNLNRKHCPYYMHDTEQLVGEGQHLFCGDLVCMSSVNWKSRNTYKFILLRYY